MPEFEGYGPKNSKSVSKDTSNKVKEIHDAPLVQELVSNDKLENKTNFPTVAMINFVRPKQQEKSVRKPANYNYHQRERVVSGNNYTRVNYNYSAQKAHPSAQRNMVPRAVLMKTGLRTLNTARPVNTAHPKTTVYSARPMSCFSKSAQSTIKSPYQTRTTLTSKNFSQKVNTAKGKFYTARQKAVNIARPKAVNTARPNTTVVNVLRENQVNVVKASAYWVWRPTKLNSASITFKRHNYVDARGRCKLVMAWATCPISQTLRNLMKDMLPLGGGAKGGKITGKGTLKTDKLDFEDVYFIKELQFNLFNVSWICDKKNNVLFTDTGCFVLSPNFKRNRTLIEAARTILADSKLPTTFWAEVVNTACYVQNRVLVVKPHNKTPYKLFRGRTPALDFMRPFGCYVTILNTLDYLGKFDGKSDDGFFIGYSLNSKAFRVYNIRTRKVEENLHIRYRKSIGAGQSSKETGSSQDYILMPLWKDGSLFDSSSKNASNDDSQPSSDSEKKDDESGSDDQEKSKDSIQNINTFGPSINIPSLILNDGSLNINTVSPTINTARSNGSQSGSNMFPFRNNTTLEATHADFFGDETEVDMIKINTTYPVPSTPNTRIHKDYSLENMIGRAQEGNPSIKRSKLDRSYARRASAIFAPVARIEAIRLFLPYASLMNFVVYQMDVKSAFLYGKIEEEVYLLEPDDIIFGSTKKELCTKFKKLMHKKFQMSSMDEILKKFGFLTVRIASTPMETLNLLLKDTEAEDVDVYLYRSMIGSLMYLTASRPYIMFVVCTCASFQVTPKVSHLHAVKIIFRYLKGQPKLGLWYPMDSPFDLETFYDSDYAGASL
ncbi:putative ribonuclease H-like domain-containing protein, partial [Tanacetum coccineum]